MNLRRLTNQLAELEMDRYLRCHIGTEILSKKYQAVTILVHGILENTVASKFRRRAGIRNWLAKDVQRLIMPDGMYFIILGGKDVEDDGEIKHYPVILLGMGKKDFIIDPNMGYLSRPDYGMIYQPFFGKRRTYTAQFSPAGPGKFYMNKEYIKAGNEEIKKREIIIRPIIHELAKQHGVNLDGAAKPTLLSVKNPSGD